MSNPRGLQTPFRSAGGYTAEPSERPNTGQSQSVSVGGGTVHALGGTSAVHIAGQQGLDTSFDRSRASSVEYSARTYTQQHLHDLVDRGYSISGPVDTGSRPSGVQEMSSLPFSDAIASTLVILCSFLAGAWIGRTVLAFLRSLILGKIGVCSDCPKVLDGEAKDS